MGIFDVQNFASGGGMMPGQVQSIAGAMPTMMASARQKQNAPLDAIRGSEAQAMQNLQMGLTDASTTLQPTIDQGNQYQQGIMEMLMGSGDVSGMPGYNAMQSARQDAIGDLGTGMAGTGKFFSGTTAEQAANIGGAMENQFRQQALQNMFMGAQPGQQATNQLAGFQMGAGQTGAQIPMTAGSNIANMMMGQQQLAAQQAQAKKDRKAGMFGDILGLAGTVGGFMLGGPPGAVAGGALGSAAGGAI